jgi:hypothetical protein
MVKALLWLKGRIGVEGEMINVQHSQRTQILHHL